MPFVPEGSRGWLHEYMFFCERENSSQSTWDGENRVGQARDDLAEEVKHRGSRIVCQHRELGRGRCMAEDNGNDPGREGVPTRPKLGRNQKNASARGQTVREAEMVLVDVNIKVVLNALREGALLQ